MTGMIDKIKTQGAHDALRHAVTSRLQGARSALEKATYDNYQRFDDCLAEARALIEEAELCFRELPPPAKKKR